MDIIFRKQELSKLLKIDEKKRLILDIQKRMSEPNFWQDREQAEELTKKLSTINNIIDKFENATTEAEINELEKHTLLNGPYDENNALLSIYSGAGGTEAQDWAQMLLKMYQRWAQNNGHNFKLLDISYGEEAGIKSASAIISGTYAYGWLKSESGVHRLVRLSPFDADHARHTSFALVEIIPEFKEAKEVTIDPKDIRIDVYRSSGHGGQGVNTTDSAVRITHISTGIVVTCQNERSQIQNRETALKILQTRLYRLKLQQEAEKRQEIRGELMLPEWGSQIRSYVLHPYKLVKDHRTNLESAEPDKVLSGDVNRFMEEYLKYKKITF